MVHPPLPELHALAARIAEMHGFQLRDIQLLTYLNKLTVQIQIQHQGGDGLPRQGKHLRSAVTNNAKLNHRGKVGK